MLILKYTENIWLTALNRMFLYFLRGRKLIFVYNLFIFSPPGATQPIVGVYFTALYRSLASSRTRLLDHTQRRATFGRTPLNEWSFRRRDLYLTTHNTHKNIHAPGGIRTHDRSRRATVDLRLRPRGYWDRQFSHLVLKLGQFMSIRIIFLCI